MSWTRLGLTYKTSGDLSWSRSHAAQPTPVPLRGNVIRFYFSTRDNERRSHVGWVDIDMTSAPKVLASAQTPVLRPGNPGAFDDSGISIGSAVVTDDEIRIYYMGWNLGVIAPWRNAIGFIRAPNHDSPFERFSLGPIVDRSPEDPYTLSYPWVVKLATDDWRMWYGSSLSWGVSIAGTTHVIKHARSRDGIRWERNGKSIVPVTFRQEQLFSRPTVLSSKTPLMMFACRGERYSLGAAVCADGESWTRQDERFGLGPGDEAWENEEVCYPALFFHGGRMWLAYNGNQYGATGFGLAVWEGPLPGY